MVFYEFIFTYWLIRFYFQITQMKLYCWWWTVWTRKIENFTHFERWRKDCSQQNWCSTILGVQQLRWNSPELSSQSLHIRHKNSILLTSHFLPGVYMYILSQNFIIAPMRNKHIMNFFIIAPQSACCVHLNIFAHFVPFVGSILKMDRSI